jgi:signal transduction histidine kinase/CheY-like chemotaxis protein
MKRPLFRLLIIAIPLLSIVLLALFLQIVSKDTERKVVDKLQDIASHSAAYKISQLPQEPRKRLMENQLLYSRLRRQVFGERQDCLKKEDMLTPKGEEFRSKLEDLFLRQIYERKNEATLIFFGSRFGGLILAGRRPSNGQLFVDRTWGGDTTGSAFLGGGYYQYTVKYKAEGHSFTPAFWAEPLQFASRPLWGNAAAISPRWTAEENGFRVQAFDENVNQDALLFGISKFKGDDAHFQGYDASRRPWYEDAKRNLAKAKIYPYFNGSGLGLSAVTPVGIDKNGDGVVADIDTNGDGQISEGETEVEGVLAYDMSLATFSDRIIEALAVPKSGEVAINLECVIVEKKTGKLVAATVKLPLTQEQRHMREHPNPEISAVGNLFKPGQPVAEQVKEIVVEGRKLNVKWTEYEEEEGDISWFICTISGPNLIHRHFSDAARLVAWTLLAVSALVGAALWYVCTSRERAVREEESIMSRHITHDMNNSLQSLSYELRECVAEAGQPVEPLNPLNTRLRAVQKRVEELSRWAHKIGLDYRRRLTREKPSFSAVELASLVESTVTEMRPMAHAKGINLYADIPTETRGFTVGTHPESVLSILRNLLQNAIKYAEQGAVTCAIKSVSEKCAELSVTNLRSKPSALPGPTDGAGYRRSSNAYTGLGLGLSLVASSVRALGGKLTLPAAHDDRTVFNFTLRNHPGRLRSWRPHDNDDRALKPWSPDQPRPTLLIAEDSEEQLAALTGEMSATFEVIPVKSGLEAMAALSSRPELSGALVDVGLPGADGFAVARFAKEKRSDLPVILYSALDIEADRAIAHSSGARALVVKQGSTGAIHRELAKALGLLLVDKIKAPEPPPAQTEFHPPPAPDLHDHGVCFLLQECRELLEEAQAYKVKEVIDSRRDMIPEARAFFDWVAKVSQHPASLVYLTNHLSALLATIHE